MAPCCLRVWTRLEVMSGRSERGTSGWIVEWVKLGDVIVCLSARSALKSMCRRESNAVTGFKLTNFEAG